MKEKFRNFFKSFIGDCCGSCVNYKNCFDEHMEYNKENTLDHPGCDNFVDKEWHK